MDVLDHYHGDPLEDVNPAFIVWAQENAINLDNKEDWEDWWKCWVDGYHHAVEDVKGIIREHPPTHTE